MISQMSHIMTLANSIIGVSVLAMPFCFKQCGIVLATLILMLSNILSRLACHFLIKSAVMSRRRNFELLAFHALGHMGKFLVELFIIGFLVGTCIAFFVVMGDLGPQIVGKVIDKNPEDIRTSLLITTSIFIVLPLGLLRNIDSLSSLCTATIIFYLCLVLKIVTESLQHLFAGDWYEHVSFWKPSGVLQCIPIFSMALFCQTQLFEIYENIPNVSLEKMNEVVRGALNICTIVYMCVGIFGYIAFCTQPFTGNILMSLEPNMSSEMIKMGFVFSIAFSFPLVIFPCRASLNSLLFRRVYAHEPAINYLPETRFRCLTIIIVIVSLITGIIIPNIEFVLGLVGSTIGVMICLIFPAIFFISISSKHTNERLLAQAILFVGICIMILSTYANLYALEESSNTKILMPTNKPHNQINNLPINIGENNIDSIAYVHNDAQVLPNIKERVDQVADINVFDKSLDLKANDVRQEPPIPVERIVVTEKTVIRTLKPLDNVLATVSPEIKRMVEEGKTLDESSHRQTEIIIKNDAPTVLSAIEKKEESNSIEMKENFIDIQKNDNFINSDAIKKEDSELAADAEAANILAVERHEKLRQTLEKHKQEQLKMMEEQKEILKDLHEQKQEIEKKKQSVVKDTQVIKENDVQLEIRNEISALPVRENITNLNNNEGESLRKHEESSNDKAFDPILSNNKNVNEKKIILSKKDRILDSIGDPNNKTSFNNKGNSEGIKENEWETGNSRKLHKGPILNALTKRASQKSMPLNVSRPNDNESNKIIQENESLAILSNKQGKPKSKTEVVQHEHSVPIVSKIGNQTYTRSSVVLMENNTDENVQVIRRDILEDHERKRRDINVQTEETDAKASSDNINKEHEEKIVVKDMQKNEKCFRQEQPTEEDVVHELKDKLIQNSSKSNTIEASLIKTNVYLSHQGFTNAVSVHQNIPIREYVNLKQRDLKSMGTR